MERDPVCGMMVDPDHAAATIDHAGKTYFFCSAGCAGKFGTDPEKYLAAPQLAQPARQADLVQFDDIRPVPSHTADSVEYTCPMHPQIVRPGPGSCPVCGMALEPRTAAAEDGENPELVSMTRRFWISVALAIPTLALGMSDIIPGEPVQQVLSMHAIGWIQFVLATPVVLWAGWPFFERGWASLVNRSLNMFTLIALGTGHGVYLQHCRGSLATAYSLHRSASRMAASPFISRQPR